MLRYLVYLMIVAALITIAASTSPQLKELEKQAQRLDMTLDQYLVYLQQKQPVTSQELAISHSIRSGAMRAEYVSDGVNKKDNIDREKRREHKVASRNSGKKKH